MFDQLSEAVIIFFMLQTVTDHMSCELIILKVQSFSLLNRPTLILVTLLQNMNYMIESAFKG